MNARYLVKWRAAIAAELLTLAPDVAAITWKRGKPRDAQYTYAGLTEERVQRAIDADDAWLKAHPTRKSLAASRQSSKPEAIAEEPERA